WRRAAATRGLGSSPPAARSKTRRCGAPNWPSTQRPSTRPPATRCGPRSPTPTPLSPPVTWSTCVGTSRPGPQRYHRRSYRRAPVREVVFELKKDGRWVRLASLTPSEPPASVSSHDEGGRQMYLAGWLDGEPGVWRSVGGTDEETDIVSKMTESGPVHGRWVGSHGLEQVADLKQGPH